MDLEIEPGKEEETLKGVGTDGIVFPVGVGGIVVFYPGRTLLSATLVPRHV
jgi:hypothetical protein